LKKTFLLKITVVTIISIVTYVFVIFLMTFLGLDRWISNARNTAGRGYYTYSRFKEVENINKVEILFLGSSHLYRGVDTRVFKKNGIKTFNFATSGQTPLNSYYLLKEYVRQLKPQVVVLDIYFEGLNDDGVNASIEIASNHRLSDGILDMVYSNISVKSISSLLAIQISRLHTPLSDVKEIKLVGDEYVEGGFIESDIKENELSLEQLKSLSQTECATNNIQKESLQKIVNLCKENNISLIFTILPTTIEFLNKVNNYENCTSEIRNIANKNGIVMIDYNKDKRLHLNSINDFLDANHLNPNGALKISELLLQDLKNLASINSED
jgi:hypothetical protein